MPEVTDQIALDPVAKKTVLRLLTYGLYAIGVARGEDRNMFTANWLTQVSFDPPLLALSVENNSHSIDLIAETGVFTVSVLGEDQRDVAGLLGKRWNLRPNKIDEVQTRPGVTGGPILEDALGAVECRVIGSMPAGDSTVLIAEVIVAEAIRGGTPLSMASAGFRHAG